ncbi:hypothetical protein JCM11491_002035 [Sporobolomyces phaffii]
MSDPNKIALPPITVEPSCPPSPPSIAPPPPQPSPLSSFAAEMFVWLWFAPTHASETEQPEKDADSRMQFAPSHRFIAFCHDVLTTTQVSHSVVLLALLFVSRLKQKNAIKGSPGSEFRLAVTGLMLANKVLDDNTYTARTWSQVSSLELKKLVAGEAEFLKGLNWSLHVTEREFRSFLKLLEGHVAARNARIGRAPRKIASTSRVRRHADKLGGGGETGLGITTSSNHLLGPSPVAYSNGDRNVRRRMEGTASATSTPTMGFGTFSYPVVAPTSAPHPGPQPQPVSAEPTFQAPNHRTIEISPTSAAPAARPVGQKKRNLDEMSKPFSFPSLPHLLLPTQPAPMSRSQSSSAAFSASTPAHAPPSCSSSSSLPRSSPSPLPTPTNGSHFSLPRHTQFERVEQIHHDFNALADSFSPQFDPSKPLHQRLNSLDYYSLAAGQGQGHLHQIPPPLVPSMRHVPPHVLPAIHPGYHTHVPNPHVHSAGGSLSSSPYTSRPARPSILSGLRSSPPSVDPNSPFSVQPNLRRASQQPPPLHPLTSHAHFDPGQVQQNRRPSKVASSPGYPTFEDGTSTPRPSTGGSSIVAEDHPRPPFGYDAMGRLPPLPAGQHSLHLPQLVPVPGPWSAYANAGPPGVYWVGYPPH